MEKEDGKINYARRGWLSLLAVPATVIIYILLSQLWNNKLYDWYAIIIMLSLITIELAYSAIIFFYASKTIKYYVIIAIILSFLAILFGLGTFFGAFFD